MTRYFSEVCLAPDGEGISGRSCLLVSSAQPGISLVRGFRRARILKRIASRPRCRDRPSSVVFRRHALPRHGRSRVHRLAPPACAARTRPRCCRVGRVHRLLRSCAEGGERPRPAGTPVDLAEDDVELAGLDGSSTSRASRASRASAASSPSTSARTCSRASGSSRQPRRRGFASSSRPRPRSTETRPRTRRRRTRVPQPISPYGITKLACEHLAARLRSGVRPRGRHRALLHDLRPAPASRHGLHENRLVPRGGASVRALRRRVAVPQLHVRRRRGRGDHRHDGAGGAGSTYNVGGGAEVSMLEAIERSGGSPDAGSRSSAASGARVTRPGRPRTRRGSERSWAGSLRRRSRTASRLNGAGPLIGSRPDELHPSGSRARGRAGSRPLLRLATPQAALVAPGRRPRRRRDHRHRARARRRLRLARADDHLPRPAVRPARRRADPEPRDESTDGGRDRPLGVGAEGGVGAERHPGVEAPLGDLDEGDRRGRPAPRREPVGGDHGQGLRQAEGRARRRRARASRDRPRLPLRHAEDRPSRARRSPPRDAARRGQRPHPCGPEPAGDRPRRPLDPARPAPAVDREPQLGHHHRRRPPGGSPGIARRVAAAPEPRAGRRDRAASWSRRGASKTTARSSRSSLLVGR